MRDQWGNLRSAMQTGDWFTVCEVLWKTDAKQQHLMKEYIASHLDKSKSHIVVEMLGKVMKRVYFGTAPFEYLRTRFQYQPSNGGHFTFNQDDVVIVFEAVDGSIYILGIEMNRVHNYNFDLSDIDICGSLEDLQGEPLIRADVLKSDLKPVETQNTQKEDHHQWVFYHFATHKGRVTLRWIDFEPTYDAFYTREARVYVFEPSEYDDYEF